MSVVVSGTPIALFCLVRESKAPFKVTIGRDNDVSDFKKFIKNEKPNDFATIDIDNIKLWKLNEPVSSENIEELREITLQGNENVTLLVETNDIVDYWAEDQIPLKKRIHVIVELPEQPVAVKRSHSPSVESRESKKGKIIEEGFSNIVDLVGILRANEEEAIMSTSISTGTGTGKGKDKVVEEEIIEPRVIIKHPQEKPLAVIGKPALFVRESYEDLYQLIINKASKGSKHKFLVTGTSGIGKSCFMIYFLIRLLWEFENVTIIFQPIQSEHFYCFEDLNLSSGSYGDFSTYLQSSKTWYLVDGNISPKSVPAKTVIALSPKGLVNDAFQEIEKDVVQKFHMSPWSLAELSSGRHNASPL